MSKRLPFGWSELSDEARALLRDRPDRFVRDILTDGPAAQGVLDRAWVRQDNQPAQLDLFAPADADQIEPDQQELF